MLFKKKIKLLGLYPLKILNSATINKTFTGYVKNKPIIIVVNRNKLVARRSSVQFQKGLLSWLKFYIHQQIKMSFEQSINAIHNLWQFVIVIVYLENAFLKKPIKLLYPIKILNYATIAKTLTLSVNNCKMNIFLS